MAFRYINPGYVSLLDSNANGATQITDRKKSKTGVGFNQIYTDVGITLSDFAEGDDFWGKFDFFIQYPTWSTQYIYCYIPNTNQRGIQITFPSSSTNTVSIVHRYDSSTITLVSGLFEIVGFKWNSINTVTFHAKLGNANTAKLELFIGDNKFVSTGRAMAYSESYAKKAILYSISPNVWFSNIIFSNEEISPKEQTLALPISQTITDMTESSNGIYLADAANQTLLQSVDVAQIIENYGASSAVTGIALVGNPAYRTSEGLANLTALSKVDGIITEHDTHNLSDDSTAFIMDGRTIQNMTVADLQNMQFGWKAGE